MSNHKEKDEKSLEDLLSSLRHIVTPVSTETYPNDIIDLNQPLEGKDAPYEAEEPEDTLSEKVQKDLEESLKFFCKKEETSDHIYESIVQKALGDFFSGPMESSIKRHLVSCLEQWMERSEIKKFIHQHIVQWMEKHMGSIVQQVLQDHFASLKRFKG